jgi:DNA-binding LacI/PurR family transcriptional regulator
VLAVIDELGYEPNAAARALSTGRTRTVGVVARICAQRSVVERMHGIFRVMAGSGYQLAVFDLEQAAPLAELSVSGRLDGLLCISLCPSDAVLERYDAAGVPVVLVDCEHPRLSGASTDDVEGGRLAAEHLLGLGHRRIAFVGDEEDDPFGFTSSARRRIGAAAALAAAGLDLLVRCGPHGREQSRALASELLNLEEPPTAVFAGSDLQALGVLEAAEAAGLDVPGDLSVMGFDDVEVARYAGLTTVAQPLEESGARGAELLLEAMRGGPRVVQRLPLQLVVRSTTAAPRAPAAVGRRNTKAAGTAPAASSRQDGIIPLDVTGLGGAQCPDV